MNFQRIYEWIVENWILLSTGICLLGVLVFTWIYTSGALKEREDHLKQIRTKKEATSNKISPEFATLEPSVEGLLVAPPESYKPLIERLQPKQDWGDSVRNWNPKLQDVPLQKTVPMRGPS